MPTIASNNTDVHTGEEAETTSPTRRRKIVLMGVLSALLYVGTILAGNAALQRWGVRPIGFGLSAPVGVYFIGVALVARDGVQVWLGKRWMLTALVAGCALSFLIAPHFALASAAAFAVSELCDFALFSWIAPRWSRAVLVGGIVGALLDSLVFLHFAFHSYNFLPGQILGKAYGISLAAILVAARRARTSRR